MKKKRSQQDSYHPKGFEGYVQPEGLDSHIGRDVQIPPPLLAFVGKILNLQPYFVRLGMRKDITMLTCSFAHDNDIRLSPLVLIAAIRQCCQTRGWHWGQNGFLSLEPEEEKGTERRTLEPARPQERNDDRKMNRQRSSAKTPSGGSE